MNDKEKSLVIEDEDIREIQEDEPVEEGWFSIEGIGGIIFLIMPLIIMFLLC